MAADIHAGFTALNRFGLGSRRGGDLAAAALDPRGFIKAELERPGIAALEGPELPRTALALKILFADEEQQRLERLAGDMKSSDREPGRAARDGEHAAVHKTKTEGVKTAASNPASLPC